MASETIIANLKAVLNVGMADSARGIKEAETRIDAFSKKMESAVKRMNDSSKNLLGNRGQRTQVKEFEDTFKAVQLITTEVGQLQRELVSAGRSQGELRSLTEAYRQAISRLLPLDKQHSAELQKQLGLSKGAFNVEGVVSKKQAVRDLSKEMDKLRRGMQTITEVEGDLSPSQIEQQRIKLAKARQKSSLDQERVATETQQRITEVNRQAAEKMVRDTSNAAARKVNATQNGVRQEVQAIIEAGRVKASAIAAQASSQLAVVKATVAAEEAAVKQEFNVELDLIKRMGDVKKLAGEQAAQEASREIRDKQRKTQLTEAQAAAELKLKKAKLDTDTARKLAKEQDIQNKINAGLAQQSVAYKKVNDEVKRLEKAQIRLQKAREKAEAALKSKGTLAAAQATGNLTDNLRNLSSATVLAVGPLSGIGARLTALSAIAGRANLKLAAMFATLSAGVLALAKFASEAIRVAKELDQVERLLGFVDKGARKQGTTFQFLAKTADLYGLSLNEIARPFAKFAFASTAAGIAGRKFQTMVQDISAVSGAFGLPSSEVSGIVKALEQMLSKGSVFAEELRQQLGDRLPGAALAALRTYRKMLNDMNLSMADFMSDMKKGLVDSTKFVPKFTQELRDMFGIETGKAVDTLTASYSRLNTNFDLFIRSLDKSLGFTEALRGILNDTSTALRMLRGNTEGVAKSFKLLFSVFSAIAGLKLLGMFVGVVKTAKSATVAVSTLKISLSALGATIGTILATVGAKGLFASIFGSSAETTTAAQRAAKAVETITGSIRGTAKSFDLSKAVLGDEASVRGELDKMIKAMNKGLENKIVIRPSLNPDKLIDSLTQESVASERIISGFEKLLKKAQRYLGQSTRPKTVQKWTEEVARLKKGMAEQVEVLRKTSAPFEALRKKVFTVTDKMRELDASTKSNVQSMTAWGSIVQLVVGNADKLINVLSAVVAGIFALKLSATIIGFTKWGQTMGGLTGKMSKFQRGLGLVGLALTGIAASLAFFSSEAKAAIKDTDNLQAKLGNFFKSFESTGKVSLESTSRIIEDIKAQRDTNKKMIDDLVIGIERYKTTIERNQISDRTVRSFRDLADIFGKDITSRLNVRNLVDAKKALESLKDQNADLAIQLSRTTGMYGTLIRKIGDADRALLKSGRGGLGGRAYENLLSRIDAVNTQLYDVRNSTSEAEMFFRKLADQSEKLAQKLLKAGLTAEIVGMKLKELRGAQVALFQGKNQKKAEEMISALRGRYDALTNGQLRVHDAQQKINSQVEKFKVLLLNSGMVEKTAEFTAKIEEYRSKLSAIDAAGAKAKKGIKQVITEAEKLDKTIRGLVEGSFNSFADSIGTFASEGELSFRNMKSAFNDMAKSMIKDLISLTIKLLVVKPLMESLGGGGSNLFGTGTGNSFVSGLASSFLGGSTKMFAKGGVVNRDTPFTFNGGQKGVFGEAGPEAIMPLTRGPGGVLGVANHGGGDGGGINVVYEINASGAVEGTAELIVKNLREYDRNLPSRMAEIKKRYE